MSQIDIQQRNNVNKETSEMFIYLDTETTGSGTTDRICQIAFKTDDGTTVDELFNPNMPISVEAMSIHHITNEMVAGKPLFKGQAIMEYDSGI